MSSDSAPHGGGTTERHPWGREISADSSPPEGANINERTSDCSWLRALPPGPVGEASRDRRRSGGSPLQAAAYGGHTVLVQLLLAAGPGGPDLFHTPCLPFSWARPLWRAVHIRSSFPLFPQCLDPASTDVARISSMFALCLSRVFAVFPVLPLPEQYTFNRRKHSSAWECDLGESTGLVSPRTP